MQQLIPILVLGALMYVALILPQQRKTKEHRALLASVQEGDEVVLNSGIHGFVQADIMWIEVADRVELKVTRSAIATKLKAIDDAEPAPAKADKSDKTDKNDKNDKNEKADKSDTTDKSDS